MLRKVLTTQVFLVFASTAVQADETPETICAKATATPLVVPEFNGPLSAQELHSCDELDLYYGFTRSPNPAAALQCGYYQRSHPRPAEGRPFYGPGVLTMLYANGLGVSRDINLAIRFTCENPCAAPAEIEGRQRHLEQLRAASSSMVKFDLCDDATSGLMVGACAYVQSRFKSLSRSQALTDLQSAWTAATKKAFERVAAAEEAFSDARADNEVDWSGTARAMFSIAEKTVFAIKFS